jgi:predicted outer membrane repeat protein
MNYFKISIFLIVLMVMGTFSGIYAVKTVQDNNQIVTNYKTNNTNTNGTKTIYVSKNGTDRNDGLTPVNPKRNIIHALDAVNNGDTIKVAPGTYLGNLQIDKNITLIGTTQNNTIIDGQGSKCIYIPPGVTVTITNFNLKNGTGTNSGFGGAILNDGILTLKNSSITDSRSECGGGIYNCGTMTILGSTIKNNIAKDYGGGISSSGTLTIEKSTITNNSVRKICGGGIHNDGLMTIIGVNIINNNATYAGGGINNDGILTVEDSTITANKAGNSGGGISNSNLLNVYGSNITYNLAKGGGGISNHNKAYVDAFTKITRNTFNNIQGKPIIPA